MKKYEVLYEVSEKDIADMINLDSEVYDFEDRGVLDKCLEWQKICPELYTVIKHAEEVVGYINFIPISKNAYDKIANGELKDYQLALSDILPFKVGNNYCLFMSIVLKNEFRHTRALMHLVNAWKEKIDAFKKRGVIIKSVISDCVTIDGEKVAKHFNGKLLRKTKNSKIYEFKL